MLLRFSFQNFRSFKSRTTLSMLATTQRTLNDVLIRTGKHRALPCAVLFGANASGKSNIVLAMRAFCEIVRNGSVSRSESQIMFNLELFPFVHDYNKEPISFEVDFILDGDRFIYSLSISVDPLKHSGGRHIVEEKLAQVLPNATVMLFHRDSASIVVGTDKNALSILGFEDTETLRKLVNSVVQNMDDKTLFLTGGFKSTIRKAVADKIIGNFSKYTLALFNQSDVFLNAIKIIQIDLDISDKMLIQNDMINIILKAADLGPQEIGWLVKEDRGSKQGAFSLEMFSIYNDNYVPSALMESAGTIRFLYFAFLLRDVLDKGSLLMIDEMDYAIHPELMKAIIALFNNPEANKKGAQLVFTSHNPVFMDHDLLRRDQILFTEKDSDTYESTLHSLADSGSVSVRNDHAYMRNYLKGKYSKLPYIDLEAILTQGMEV